MRLFLLQISFIFSVFGAFNTGNSQTALSRARVRTVQASWQQRADHDIRVYLDEKRKYLLADQTLVYTNNSPGELREIHMHIWPNAFRDRTTAYGRESVVNGGKFYHVTPEDAGWIDSLSFTADGKPTTFRYHPDHTDIIIVTLPEPLATGAAVTLRTPFRVKIPWLFSRFGHNEGIFSITQWYPKPAVYDANGWNTFPYAEQGEYYSEFGSYNVILDVPANFRIAATGRLMDSSELLWLTELAEGAEEEEARSGRKTLRYQQDNVCDFAWFAAEDFKVKKGAVSLPGGRKVTSFAFYRGSTSRPLPGGKSLSMNVDGGSIISSIDKALTYYSRRVGTYPYDYCSVVIGPLQGAGGMEYPMVTICADASEGTVIHEVGHNWFQGMLGSNERRYPWMDESVNTFYQQQAEGKGAEELSPGDRMKPTGGYAGFRLSHDMGVYQCGHLHSRDYTSTNYGTIVYGINPQRFLYLQEYLGRNLMDSCMRTYFKTWCFRHPLPDDMQKVFEQVSRRNLSWFFKDLLGGPAPDYAISSVRKSSDGLKVKVKNKGTYSLPVKLQWRNGTRKEFVWISGDSVVSVKGRPDQVVLNGTGYLPESNLANNDASTRGILRTWGKTKIGFPSLYKRGENRVWFLPWLFSWNRYDGWMPGAVFSNISFPRRNWEWWAAPMYGIRSKEITGSAGLRRNIFHKNGPLSLTEVSTYYRRFSFRGGVFEEGTSPYNRFAFNMTSYFKRARPWVQSRLEMEYTLIRLDRTDYLSPQYDSAGNITEYRRRFDKQVWESDLARVSFIRESKKKMLPTRLRADVRFGGNRGVLSFQNDANHGNFIMYNVEGEAFIHYPNRRKKNIGLYVKGWFSGMQDNIRGAATKFVLPVSAPQANPNDFGFSNNLIGRSAVFRSGDGIWSNMLLPAANGIRMFPNMNTERWVGGVNVQTHVLPFLPVQVYADAAYSPFPAGEKLLYAGGLVFNQRIGINTSSEIALPLFYSNTFRDYVKLNDFRWYQLVNFKINLDLNNPFSIVRSILN